MSQGHIWYYAKNDIISLAHDGLKVMKAGTAELEIRVSYNGDDITQTFFIDIPEQVLPKVKFEFAWPETVIPTEDIQIQFPFPVMLYDSIVGICEVDFTHVADIAATVDESDDTILRLRPVLRGVGYRELFPDIVLPWPGGNVRFRVHSENIAPVDAIWEHNTEIKTYNIAFTDTKILQIYPNEIRDIHLHNEIGPPNQAGLGHIVDFPVVFLFNQPVKVNKIHVDTTYEGGEVHGEMDSNTPDYNYAICPSPYLAQAVFGSTLRNVVSTLSLSNITDCSGTTIDNVYKTYVFNTVTPQINIKDNPMPEPGTIPDKPKEEWRLLMPGNQITAPVKGLNAVYVGGSTLSALAPDKSIIWQYICQGNDTYSQPQIGPNGVIYTVFNDRANKKIYLQGFNTDGSKALDTELAGSTSYDPDTVFPDVIFAVNDTIDLYTHFEYFTYFGGNVRHVYYSIS